MLIRPIGGINSMFGADDAVAKWADRLLLLSVKGRNQFPRQSEEDLYGEAV